MSDETEKPKFLVAPKGFSANGITVAAGEYESGKFDAQTTKVLIGMGRYVPTDEPDEAPTKKKGKAADAGLPGLPGA